MSLLRTLRNRANSERMADRDARIWQLYTAHMSVEQIASQEHLSWQRIYQILNVQARLHMKGNDHDVDSSG